MFNHLLHLDVKSEIIQIYSSTCGVKHLIHLSKFTLCDPVPRASSGLCSSSSRASPPGDSSVWLNRLQLLSVIFNAQQSSPCLLCLVCLSVSFSCSRLIQIKLSFMFLSRSPLALTENYRQTCKSKHTACTHVLCCTTAVNINRGSNVIC